MYMKPVQHKKGEIKAIYSEKGQEWTLETFAARTGMSIPTARQALIRADLTDILKRCPRIDDVELVRLIEEEGITGTFALKERLNCSNAALYKHLRKNGYEHLIGTKYSGRPKKNASKS